MNTAMEYSESYDVATPDYRQRRRASGYGTDERSPLVDVDVSPIDLTVSSERNVTVRDPPRQYNLISFDDDVLPSATTQLDDDSQPVPSEESREYRFSSQVSSSCST